MVKKGDTLIEVTLAISIFSLVAIAVVAVVSSSTTSAQTALEMTLAREEIDAQAEALRFIQSSYANGGNEENNPYRTLWDEITGTSTAANDISHSNPASCTDIYNTDDDLPTSIFNAENRSFIINTRKLGHSTNTSDIIVRSFAQNAPNKKFTEASTYPRIIYVPSEIESSEDEDEVPTEEALLDNDRNSVIYHIEGIYVTAVPGPSTVIVKNSSNAPLTQDAAYHDFYIRTCWYGAGNSMPSTISTVVRLYNPAAFNQI